MATSSHNHRRKLIRKCRREAFRNKWTPIPLTEWRALRQKGHELFREKVAAIVKDKEGVGIPLTAFIPEQAPA